MGRPVTGRWREEQANLIEDVEFLATSTNPADIAARLGLTQQAIERRLYRYGRPDLARMFTREGSHANQSRRRALRKAAA